MSLASSAPDPGRLSIKYSTRLCVRADNTPKTKAKQMYRAVMLFGPRWDAKGELQPIEVDGNELYL